MQIMQALCELVLALREWEVQSRRAAAKSEDAEVSNVAFELPRVVCAYEEIDLASFPFACVQQTDQAATSAGPSTEVLAVLLASFSATAGHLPAVDLGDGDSGGTQQSGGLAQRYFRLTQPHFVFQSPGAPNTALDKQEKDEKRDEDEGGDVWTVLKVR